MDPSLLKNDVVAVYGFDNRDEFLAVIRKEDGKLYVREGYDIDTGTSYIWSYYSSQGFGSLNDVRSSIHERYHNLKLLYEDVMKIGSRDFHITESPEPEKADPAKSAANRGAREPER